MFFSKLTEQTLHSQPQKYKSRLAAALCALGLPLAPPGARGLQSRLDAGDASGGLISLSLKLQAGNLAQKQGILFLQCG